MFKNIRHAIQLLLFICLVAAIALPAVGETATPVTENVAVVNGTQISKKSFDQELLVSRSRIEQQGQKIPESQLPEFKKHIIKQLIGTELLFQDSKQKGIVVSNEKVSQFLTDIKKRYPTEEQFQKDLVEMNMSEDDMKSRLKKSIAIQELIEKHLAKNATVTDEEAKTFYDKRPELFKSPPSVKASHILIKSSPTAKPAEKDAAMKKIKDVQEKLKQGGDFAELAKTHSEGPSGPKGGDLGFFSQGQMVKPFETAAFALSPGEISDIVETRFGYHLIKVSEKKESQTVSFDQAKEKIIKNLTRNKTQQIIEQHIETLKNTAKIETLI